MREETINVAEAKKQLSSLRDLAIDDPDGYKITIAKDLKKR